MINVIIIAVVVVVLILAVRSSIGHFKGEGDCCSGGSEILNQTEGNKTLSGPVIGKKRLTISGMHCDHCVQSVTSAINRIDGAVAKVDLEAGTAEVSYDRKLDDAVLRQAVEGEGFTVTSIASC